MRYAVAELNDRASKKHFSEAERIARQTKDTDLVREIETARMMSDGPEALLQRLMNMGGPDLMKEFLNEFGEDFADDWK